MEAIGNLAGGVAHDINNMLAVILGFGELVHDGLEEEHPLREHLDRIIIACSKGADLTRNLLGFARKGKYLETRLSINVIVRDVVQLIERTIAKQITVVSELEAELGDVAGDPTQINQVLLNLAINAVGAMGRQGTLEFRSEEIIVGEEEVGLADLAPGAYVRLAVSDSGSGMSEETCRKAFEPFFTTKPEGEGTGLGLSMVYGTVKRHGGTVQIDSEEGKGTCVTILLPLLGPGTAEAGVDAVEVNLSARGSGTILVVDDEELVRRSAQRILERLGYQVVVAENGKVAVERLLEMRKEIGFVVLDLIMPVMDGEETLAKLKELEPELPVLITSGYSKSRVPGELLNRGACGFLQKPYTVAQLVGELTTWSALE
jgi:CheY-like chemotaxis protein